MGGTSNLRDLEPTGPPDRTYKVVFAGDAAVGKTSFINRLTKGIFLSNLSSTLGVDFQVKTIRVDDRNIAIQLWDTAGERERNGQTESNEKKNNKEAYSIWELTCCEFVSLLPRCFTCTCIRTSYV